MADKTSGITLDGLIFSPVEEHHLSLVDTPHENLTLLQITQRSYFSQIAVILWKSTIMTSLFVEIKYVQSSITFIRATSS
jgi:hypothetical protein